MNVVASVAPRFQDMFDAAADVLRPLEDLSPSEWAARHREVAIGPFRGAWDNDNGPHLVAVMDAVREAIESGRDLVVIKGAQEGVTEALGVNAVAWLLTYYAGPILYLTSKDDVAKKLSGDRWDGLLSTCEPLRRKHLAARLAGKKGRERVLEKRFTDGSLTLTGSRSMLNYLSNPYAVVVFDELDACADQLPDGSDPIATIRERLTAFAEGRPVLLIAFAHPTTHERGAARLYYEESDQRRGHVECPHCGAWFAPLWRVGQDVQVLPREGQAAAAAERDPTCYQLVATCCGTVLTDADRLKAIRRVEQRTTLPPAEARAKRWIGLHVWHLFLRDAGRVSELARKYIAGVDNPTKMIPFVNKVCGDAHRQAEQETTLDAWKRLEDSSYQLGQVTDDVQFLTSGQDSKLLDLHWAVWGWGMVPTQGGEPLLCGWLVDAGVEPGPAAVDRQRKVMLEQDLFVFDGLLYERSWPRLTARRSALRVDQGLHDAGWQPFPVGAYCKTSRAARNGRAFPSKGLGLDANSSAPATRWTSAPTWRMVDAHGKEHTITDPNLKRCDMNTYLLKVDLLGSVDRTFVDAQGRTRRRLTIPAGTPREVLEHLSSERLVRVDGELVWRKTGPNHWLDCTIMARAAAANLLAFVRSAPPLRKQPAHRRKSIRTRVLGDPMAKKKTAPAAVPIPAPPASSMPAPPERAIAQLGAQTLIPGVQPDPPRTTPRWSFPTVSRCPRCKSADTKRTSQRDDTQYRQCQVAVCRKRFPVMGKLV